MVQRGKIIVNGIEYSGGGGSSSNIVYLTQAEYDSLPDTKLTNGVEYRITDADDSIEARNIAYDNSESGIKAVSVQDAIDKLAKSLGGDATIDALISAGAEVDWTNKTVDNLSQYQNIIFCLQRSISQPMMFNHINIPYSLFKTLASESNFLTIATGNVNAYIYYVDDTTVACKVTDGWAYNLYGIKSTTVAGTVNDGSTNVTGVVESLLDYDNAIQPFSSDVTSNTSYTVPENGIFFVAWFTTKSDGTDCIAFVNGVRIAETGLEKQTISPIMVSKGDVIDFTLTNAKIKSSITKFVPYKYDSLGAFGGASPMFIDTSNMLAGSPTTNDTTTKEYTATQDCFFSCVYAGSSAKTLYIDDVAIVASSSSSGNHTFSWSGYLKQGQTAKWDEGRWSVFALKPIESSANKNLVEYSTEEQEVGTWINGKTVYRRSFELNITSKDCTLTSGAGLANKTIIKMEGSIVGKTPLSFFIVSGNDGCVRITTAGEIAFSSSSISTGTAYVTLEYIKN